MRTLKFGSAPCSTGIESGMRISRGSYISGAFYFGLLGFPIQRVETDADGKFVIQVPESGGFVIAAQAERNVGDNTEHYYWLQPVSLERSATVNSEFIEQQSHKHDGNFCVNTHEGLIGHRRLDRRRDYLCAGGRRKGVVS